MAQSKTPWAEDKALQWCNLSTVPGAKTEGGIERACSIPPLGLSLRDWPQSEKPSRQDAAKSTTGCHLPFTNTNPPQFHFPLDQHRPCSQACPTLTHKLQDQAVKHRRLPIPLGIPHCRRRPIPTHGRIAKRSAKSSSTLWKPSTTRSQSQSGTAWPCRLQCPRRLVRCRTVFTIPRKSQYRRWAA